MRRYRVFGRTEYAEPLEFRGTVAAADNDAAVRATLERFGHAWVELVLLPERSIRWVPGRHGVEASDA
jgi:hypothetical protein